MADHREILEILEVLADTFGAPKSFEGYYMALADIPASRLKAAQLRALQELKWMPKPSELRQYAIAAQDSSEAPDTILAEFYALEDAFYQDRIYSPDALERLAVLSERSGQASRAAWIREKSQRWSAVTS